MLKATNIGHMEAETIDKLPDNTVMISINEEDKLFKLKLDRLSSKLLTVQFTDITSYMSDGERQYYPISNITAHKMLQFINRNLDKNFIVHCHAGVSRSAAVCLFLHILHKYELKRNFWKLSEPNLYVLGMLMKCQFNNEIII